MERVLSISDQLQKLLDGANKDAKRIIAEAQKSASEMLLQAKAEAETKLIKVQQLSLQTEEEKIKIESSKIMDEIRIKAESMKNISNERLIIAYNLILGEVLPQ